MRPIDDWRHEELGGAASSYSSDLPSVLMPGNSTQQFYTWTGSWGSGQYEDAVVTKAVVGEIVHSLVHRYGLVVVYSRIQD